SMMSWMCQCYSAKNIAPIVRIGSPNAYEASQAIDAGAAGVVSPYLETIEEINKLRGAVKYRPLKGKRLQDVLSGKEKLSEKEIEYFKKYNEERLLILNIESRFAVDHIDELLDMPDVDAVFIGPHDLSVNLGIPEEYDNPLFEEYVEKIITACRKRGIGVGNHFSGSKEKQKLWATKGMNIVVWNSDIQRFIQVMSDDINEIKTALGDITETQKTDVII
ncbi:MAG: aldolase/citrate lyase family protein, partial [Clostridia bacterium]|nr:aldolase/citrate lyase family protein [Clostridia bacterium]